ncbi:MAG TPA: DUF6351 family protein [Solirubrobacteraceae bacterium]|nr:DUF6351 family protein [Solirubrobacteraceae bacterium]
MQRIPVGRRACVVLLLALAAVSCVASAQAARRAPVSISVLSGRPDLVSGSDALVAISPASDAGRLRVTLNGRNVTRTFAARTRGLFGGRLAGLVSGLRLGRNVLRAVLGGGSGARLVLVDHPVGGPVFSGPQLEPWTCEPGAVDAKCDKPPTYRYVYISTSPLKSGFQAYDPANPPSDVARTTTDQGITVPFVVRVETGYLDRDQYQIATLYQPGRPWAAFAPQPQWNHKLLILHGASCGVEYQSATAPDVTGSSAPTGNAGPYALGKGFMTMSTALDNSGHDCNVAVQAESLVMAKERIVERYGLLRYTIGTGCSGGSLAEQWVANAYPGVYQGILPTCSFPDAMSSATQVADYALLEHYWLAQQQNPAGRGVVWSPSQFAAVEGNALPVDALASVGCLDPSPPYTTTTCPTGYFYGAVPYWPCAGVSSTQRYNTQTNPAGVRCSIIDLNRNLLGLRSPSVWSAAEQRIRHGFTGLPIDNVGVEYGLSALRSAAITPAQFVDLNAYIGGSDVDSNPVPRRLVADTPALANAYRTGLINETNNLNQTAIIDCRGPDPGAAHDAYRAFAIRARLDREHGTHANQLIWEGPGPIVADTQCERNSFIAMDRWLSAVERDHSATPLPQKLIRDKPADLTDECYDGLGHMLSHQLCGPAVVPVYGTPRMVAGEPISTDQNKCRLVPLRRAGNWGPIPFTDAQWAQLQRAFPNGVCDFSQPGIDQQPTVPWLTYQDPRGAVIYGGRPLGGTPVSTRIASRRRHRR